MHTRKRTLIILSKLIEYIYFADSVYSNTHVGPIPKNKTLFFLLSIFVDELISTPKII